MPIFNNILAGSSGQSTGYDIDQSLRFNQHDASKLERTPSSVGNRKTWTWSGWIKRGYLNPSNQHWFFSSADSSERQSMAFLADQFYFEHTNSSGSGYLISNRYFRDVSAWYHVVVVWDTTQSTDSDRVKIYINGERLAGFIGGTSGTGGYPALNQQGEINNTSGMYIGSLNTYAGYYYEGYMSEVNFVDGQALTPASFGETNSDTNQWIAKKYAGSYGTNGFYLPFSNTELNNFVDSSSSSHAITANGNVVNSRAQEKIGTSSIKFDGTGDYLSIPNSSDFNFGTGDFTFEGWFYTDSGTDQILFSQYQDTSNRWYLRLDNRSAQESIGFYNHNGGIDIEATDNTWPGVNQWVHMAFVRASGVITIYINGSAITLKTNTSPNGTFTNNTGTLRIGDYNGGSNYSGYIDEIRISNSARYTSNFTPSITEFSSDANTKLLIHSDFDGGLGADYSGNFNDFYATNLVATDQVLDSPTNNFSTLNPLDAAGRDNTFSEGNLKCVVAAQNTNEETRSTIGVSSGKWYWEFYLVSTTTTAGYFKVGLKSPSGSNYWNVRGSDGELDHDGSTGSSSVSYTTTNIVNVAVDMDSGKWWVGTNGSWVGDPSAGSGELHSGISGTVLPYILNAGSGGTHTIVSNFGQDSSFSGNKTAQGNGGTGEDFYYAPPTGYKALNTSNLDDPSIADPTKHFNTKLWTSTSADGTSALGAVTGVGFQPDLVWAKGRSAAWDHNLFNSVMGTGLGKALYTNTNFAAGAYDTSGYGNVTSFDSDGFTVGLTAGNNYAYNYGTGTKYLAWNWKAGGTASSNSDGTITSSVSANTDAGFSIVSYTGTGTAGDTLGHGLSQAPEMVIMKKRESNGADGARNWHVWSKDLTDGNYLALNGTNAEFGARDFGEVGNGTYPYTEPTASTIYLGGSATGQYQEVNYSGDTYIMYCFHSVEGYSKVGSYVGNDQNPNGPFIYMGFKPAFLMIKAVNRSDDWIIVDNKRDSYNIVTRKLNPNTAGAEITNHAIVDFVSNGFKIKDNSDKVNLLGSNYLYLAFAKSPFKYSNAR